jgi:hypothetical protein
MKTQTNDQRDILYRLLKRLTDGSYEVVGYEKHEGGRIYHSKDIKNWDHIFKYKVTITRNLKAGTIATVDHNNYIHHDRMDQFTGITLNDGTRVFERDKIEYQTIWVSAANVNFNLGIVKYDNKRGCFYISSGEGDYFTVRFTEHYSGGNIRKLGKIIGIEGVKKLDIL